MPMIELAARYLSEWSRKWQGHLVGDEREARVQQKKSIHAGVDVGLMTRVNFAKTFFNIERTCLSLNVAFALGQRAKISFVDLKTGLGYSASAH